MNARKEFISTFSKLFCDMMSKDYEKLHAVDKAYLELAISQCMDAAIEFKDVLDTGYVTGYKFGDNK
jgi:hypothetical protein